MIIAVAMVIMLVVVIVLIACYRSIVTSMKESKLDLEKHKKIQ